MRYFIFVLLIHLLFTNCFTVKNIKRAKLDRKKEVVDTVLSSYKDEQGNIQLSFKKINDKSLYSLTIPFDSIIKKYEEEKSIDYFNKDSASNFIGVFFSENINEKRGYQRLILFNKAEKTSIDTSQSSSFSKSNFLLHKLNGDVSIPVALLDSSVNFEPYSVKTKPISFIINPKVDSNTIQKTYIIAIRPDRKKYTKYYLTPFTVGLDAITLPFQIIGYGTILLLGNTMKF